MPAPALPTVQRPASPAAQRPASDVSGMVGLLGLSALCGWIALCHFWPELVTALGLPSRAERLTGPYAALTGLVVAALPMVLYELLVTKVHRRASTGIDWTTPKPVSSIIDISITKLAGLWATWAIIGCLYALSRFYWVGNYVFAMR